MRRPITLAVLLTALSPLLLPAPAAAAEPVRRIAIHVEPYYAAARAPGERPRVAVGRAFDALLSSNAPADVRAAMEAVRADPGFVTPMVMMVLAIRLYDMGMRDEAVFWFYAAKDRYATLEAVADVDAPGLASAAEAVRAFATLAGPVINGYAFCDVTRQQRIRAEALEWVERNPYRTLFHPQLPGANPGDRRQNLADGLAEIRENAAKERAYLEDAANVEELRTTRAKNGANERYCWR